MKKPDTEFDGNKTMQLDAINFDPSEIQLSLEEPDVASEEAPVASEEQPIRARLTPPPLPPGASLPPSTASMPPPPSMQSTVAPPAKPRTVVYGVALVGVLVVGLLGGAVIVRVMRPAKTPTVAVAATGSASAAPNVITIPTVELGNSGDNPSP